MPCFNVDEQGYTNVWIDGCCFNNGQYGACAGYGVYWGPNHELNTCGPVSGPAINNNGEIEAACVAIEQALEYGIQELAINTDANFLINAATKWIRGWKARGWITASGEPVRNQSKFKRLDHLMPNLNIMWKHVSGHSGEHGNEMADQLAKQGANQYRY